MMCRCVLSVSLCDIFTRFMHIFVVGNTKKNCVTICDYFASFLKKLVNFCVGVEKLKYLYLYALQFYLAQYWLDFKHRHQIISNFFYSI